MKHLFKKEFVYWWVGLLFLLILRVGSNTENFIGWRLEDSSAYGYGYLCGAALGVLLFLIGLAAVLTLIVRVLVSKSFNELVFMIVLTALVIYGYLGYLWF